MNVSMEKIDNVSARLIVSVEENDYQEKVTKELKQIGRTHSIPGFRKGHVPFGELSRRFGKQVASDVINNDVYESVINYIRENNLGILGEPLPVEVQELDLKNQKDYTFKYEIGIAAVRGGTIVGEHEVIFANCKDEVMTFKHQVSSRETFADGAVEAMLWTSRQSAGMYNMDDLCGVASDF